MPRFTIKIKDRYFHWSTIVDAPITHGMTMGYMKRLEEENVQLRRILLQNGYNAILRKDV